MPIPTTCRGGRQRILRPLYKYQWNTLELLGNVHILLRQRVPLRPQPLLHLQQHLRNQDDKWGIYMHWPSAHGRSWKLHVRLRPILRQSKQPDGVCKLPWFART